MSNELITTEPEIILPQLGNRETIRETRNRLMKLHPAAHEIGEEGMLAAAQIAYAIGANPLPSCNELHIWKDSIWKDGKSTPIVKIHIGYMYYNRVADMNGGVLWDFQPRAMTNEEKTANGIEQNVLAATCRAMKTRDLHLRSYGLSLREIMGMKAVTGYGVEIRYKDKIGNSILESAKAGRHIMWSLYKRARVDMLKQLFPTMFGAVDNAIYESGPIESGIIIESTPPHEIQQWKPLTPAQHEQQKQYAIEGTVTDQELDTLFMDGGSTTPATTTTPTPEPTPTAAPSPTTPTPEPITYHTTTATPTPTPEPITYHTTTATPTPTPAVTPAPTPTIEEIENTIKVALTTTINPTYITLWSLMARHPSYTSTYHAKAATAKHPSQETYHPSNATPITNQLALELAEWLFERKR